MVLASSHHQSNARKELYARKASGGHVSELRAVPAFVQVKSGIHKDDRSIPGLQYPGSSGHGHRWILPQWERPHSHHRIEDVASEIVPEHFFHS